VQTIRPDEVHLLVTRPEICERAGQLSAYLDLLDEGERSRLDRLVRDTSKKEFLVTRALCRVALSQYVSKHPRAWRFEQNEYGRPFLAPSQAPSLGFNLSNTDGLVACAVSRHHVLGVDVECRARQGDIAGMARHFFCAAEQSYVLQAEGSIRTERFVELWTLKEAFIKALGIGLSLPLDSFAFQTTGRSPTVSFLDRALGHPTSWRFHSWTIEPCHRAALAVRLAERHADIDLHVIEVIPCLSSGEWHLQRVSRRTIQMSAPLESVD
jgi:4'-phosphopantetheinyl transferase